MFLVVSTAPLPAPMDEWLGEDIEHRVLDRGTARDELLGAIADADALIALLDVAVDDELMAAAPKLKVVANCAVGFNNVDLESATRRGIVVCNTPDVLTDATADLAFALLLAAARRIVEGDRLVRSGEWKGWAPDLLLGSRVSGATLGVIGMGRIGAAVARRASGFDMRVLYTATRPHDLDDAEFVDVQALVRRSDFVSIHCPLNAQTHHLLGERELSLMGGAVLINTARGPIVDEEALVRSLESGAVGAAGLDVFENEPAVHPGLVRHERVVLAPHIGSATTTTRRAMARLSAEAVVSVACGRTPHHVVNPEVLHG